MKQQIALANHACKQGFSALYLRATLLFDDLTVAKADGRYKRLLASITKPTMIILDDFGLPTLTADARRDLLRSWNSTTMLVLRSSLANSIEVSGTS